MSMVTTRDGRTLEVLSGGDAAGFPLLYHGGSPSAAVSYPVFDRAAADAGLRLITYSRPGYGESPGRPRESPRVVDDVEDTAEVLDALGVDRFVTLGWSGGGPRALACAARLPGRCLAAASIAGPAPLPVLGDAWFDGMAEENVAEYTAARAGRESYTEFIEEEFGDDVRPEDLADALGGLVPPVDREALDDQMTTWLATMLNRAHLHGVGGIVDDGLAGVADWGFDPASIQVPTAIYQGRLDAMVPYAHGEWLAATVPTARAHLTDHDGHISLMRQLPPMLAELREMAGI